ncbi:hypothetical protein R8Z50_28545 [Longispora sp. K20-0274]|uniref:hypothetical protein n=1 Tax=Longispora sp. K20-0274 TaxID=3088255 RepID=UPI003999C61D
MSLKATIAVLGLLTLAGCSGDPKQPPASADPTKVESAAQPPVAAPSRVPASAAQPAAAAGGACELLDYEVVAQALGERFQVAVSGGVAPAATCVLKQVDSRFPDLTLAVAPTKADAKVFASTVTPKGAPTVAGLGKAAYSRTLPPDGAGGHTVEVGWLSANSRMLTVRYTLPAGGDAAAAGALAPKLAELAKKIDAKK